MTYETRLNRPTPGEEFVNGVLANNFELFKSDLDSEQVTGILAEAVHSPPDEKTKIITVAGGAASGKSTLAQSLLDSLLQSGIKADRIETDDFVRGDRAWRREHVESKTDVNATAKYDFVLMNQKIEAITANTNPATTVGIPTYNQATGLAIDEGEINYQHQVGPVNALIVTQDFDAVDTPSLAFYLHVPDVKRLENRVKRDVVARGGDPQTTTDNFNLRQNTQHVPHTLPLLTKADYVIDMVSSAGDNWLFDLYRSK